MATLTTCIPVSAKEAWERGEFLSTDTYKCGLFRANASLGRSYDATNSLKYATITAATSDELSGTGYTTGGFTLAWVSGPAGATPTSITGTGAWIDFTTDPNWTSATFTTSGLFVYDDTHANKLILGIWDFGGDKSVTSGTFTVTLPTAAAATAILRFP